MTLGEKLAKLRKENNYTQEQLADILEVSRQSVSKWESDVSYPETEKLIKLGNLYGCSMDYLLKEEIEEREASEEQEKRGIEWNPCSLYFERKSRKTVRGIPLWHINIGLGRSAKGIFAIGLAARGVVSIGVFSLGVFSIGLFSLGLVALGVFALGVLAAGTISVGVLSAGAIAVGVVAFGALAIGQFSVGALAVGNYFALGDHAYAKIAIWKTEGSGSVWITNAYSPENYSDVMRVLECETPWIFGWAKELIGNVLKSVGYWGK